MRSLAIHVERMEANNMKTKRMILLLMSLVMTFTVVFDFSINQAYATGNTIRFDTAYESARIVVDGIVHNADVQIADGTWYISAQDIQRIFGSVFTEEYVSLSDYAQYADIHYTQDEALTAAYFSTWDLYAEKVSLDDFEMHAAELNLPLDKISQNTISGAEMAELLDCFVSHEAPGQMDNWKEISQKLRASHAPLCRSDALAALFVASWRIGGPYRVYEKESSGHMRDAAFAKADDRRNWELFTGAPIPRMFDVGYGAMDHYGAASCIFNLGMISPVDASHPFAYDGTSFRHDENATYLEAVVAICRVFSRTDTQIVPTDSKAATTLSGVFTEELLTKATAPSNVSETNHPQWTGFVLDGETDGNLSEVVNNVAQCANWGFNSVRLNLCYEQLFNRDVTEVNLAMLTVLDQIVAQAVKYNLHLNICMTTLPGRWKGYVGAYEEIGEFDLFLNEKKQEQAKRIFAILAERYKNFSNNYLSFTPIIEAMNYNLSSGLPFTNYNYLHYASSLEKFVEVIRSIDQERLIIVEPTPLTDEGAIMGSSAPVYAAMVGKGNIIISYNFCDWAFVYACMTVEAERNIDDENRSYYLMEYPTYYYDLDNCIVDPEKSDLRDMMPWGSYEGSGSLLIEGGLPAGTTVELYLQQTYGGELQFIADGKTVYTEELGHYVYHAGETVSRYINYAVSDKKVSVTLNEPVELLEIATPGGALTWTAMDLRLPEEYAQERWYYATPYDVFCGLEKQAGIIRKNEARVMIWPYEPLDTNNKVNRLIIHDDLSYSTSTIYASSSKETIQNLIQAMNKARQGYIIRYERALFNGGISDSIMAYYTDMFHVLNEHNVSWWSNDWWVMTNDMSESMAGVQQTSYGPYEYFNIDLLKLMQQYQSNERP